MSKKKASIKQRMKYSFDNLMSKGTVSLLLILAVITLIVVVIGGLIALALGGPDGKSAESPGSSIWFALMHAINTGVLAKEEGTVPYLFVMTIVTLVGIFITSFLIGTISNAIQDKVSSLQKGRSLVIEHDHVVIIGFDENVTSILEELALANENQKDAVVVIMANHDKTDMEDTIRDRVSDLGSLRVVCRSGHPDSVKDLKVCSLDTCKSIIVNLADDFMTVKTILACESLLDDYGNTDAFITATVREREVLQPAQIAGGERAEILNFQKTIARLMVQSCRHPGMSEVLAELLSFKGNEIYVEAIPGSAGLSLAELNQRLPRSVAIGLVRGDEPLINPDVHETIQENDQLILIAEDDESSSLQDATQPNESLWAQESPSEQEPYTLLVFGATDMLKQILIEEDACSIPGSRVIVAVEPNTLDRDALPRTDELKNIELEVREDKIFSRRVLEALVAERPSSILLLSDPSLDDDEADAHNLMLQLQLTDIAEDIGADVPLTIEMNSTRNQRLSQMMRATDFVVSSRITAKMMAQVAEERHKKSILNNLLSDGGSSIYMKPVTRYVKTDEPVDFATLSASAVRYGEIAIGYKRLADDGSFSVGVNPANREAIQFGANDELIVVAQS